MDEGKIVNAAVLGNAVEAERIASVLTERGIPFTVVMHDHILGDGIFSVREGWGHIEAPEPYRDEIAEIYGDLFSGPVPEEEDGE